MIRYVSGIDQMIYPIAFIKKMCIRDRILTAPIKMPDNTTVLPDKGTPQGGIISPLLANIVLNELAWWIASQWEENPIAISLSLIHI